MRDSVQAADGGNERTIGKSGNDLTNRQQNEVTKNERRGRQLQMLRNPPSIPTKYQTVYYEENEPKAFNSTRPRFEYRMHELPGPGYYSGEGAARESHSHQESRRGTGGFASHAKRFTSNLAHSSIVPVGPGSYNIDHAPVYSHHLHRNGTSVFREPIAGAANKKPQPGPASYNRQDIRSHVEEGGATFVFRSKTHRSVDGTLQDLPPPGAYEFKDEFGKQSTSAAASFKATSRSTMVTSKDAVMRPGPGYYDVVKMPPVRVQKSASDTALNLDALAAIFRYQKDHRDTKSTLIFLKTTGPGPGSYDTLSGQVVNGKTLSKGAKGGFVSKTPRFREKEALTPGPGAFCPIPPSNTKFNFHMNLESRWVC